MDEGACVTGEGFNALLWFLSGARWLLSQLGGGYTYGSGNGNAYGDGHKYGIGYGDAYGDGDGDGEGEGYGDGGSMYV